MLTLFAQFYVPETEDRLKEIYLSFKNNIENQYISKFVIYFEKESDKNLLPDLPKIDKRLRPSRLTYGFWLSETNDLPTGTISVLINSDIYLTNSINILYSEIDTILFQKKFIALTRYNPEGNSISLNSNPHWTQDTWIIVKGQENIPKELIQEASFELGQPGCDNKIVAVMHSYGYSISNPCEIIKTVHLHGDERRFYDSKRNKLLGLHAFAYPTKIVSENSSLEFELLCRNDQQYEQIRINNWINNRKDYFLRANSSDENSIISNNKNITLGNDFQNFKHNELNYTSKDNYEYQNLKFFDKSKFKLYTELNNQYSIYFDDEYWYFYDKFWPFIKRIKKYKIELDQNEQLNIIHLFSAGFLPAVFLREDINIASKRNNNDVFFWQLPVSTELDSYIRHKKIDSPNIKSNAINIYIPLPWATIIDQLWENKKFKKNKKLTMLLIAISSRIRSARRILKDFNFELHVHTVCQHIQWKEVMFLFSRVGITDLWTSHKCINEDVYQGIKLHSWPIFAVNVENSDRRIGLNDILIQDRKYLGSFIGAYMSHYIGDTRLKLKEIFSNVENYYISVNDEWHFNRIVYPDKFDVDIKKIDLSSQIVQYNQVLSDSKFSFCPVGAGPNTIRLWESLAIGSIPIVLSDKYQFPRLKDIDNTLFDWNKAVVFCKEDSIEKLDQLLKSFSTDELQTKSTNAKLAYELSKNLTCFGEYSNQSSFRLIKSVNNEKLKVLVPYYGPEDRIFWRNKHHGIYDIVMEWNKTGLCDIEYHNGLFYWIGEIGSILLFDRDQINDLVDDNKISINSGYEVDYKYGFFVNEYNLENDRNFKFNYWSSKPVELEIIANSHELIPYDERSIDTIFLGSIENEVQEFLRSKFADWSTEIDEYFVSDKLNRNEPLKYSFEQYIEKISSAKFGLCFRGNGPKCFREIEYTAVGTPLIITSGVEINYPDPLLEGVHYFYANKPEDIRSIINNTSPEEWTVMSKNCREWYQRNCTLKALHYFLESACKKLNLNLKKPKYAYVLEDDLANYIAIESFKIFNPNVELLKFKNCDNIEIIDSNYIYINELPYLNSQNNYCYKIHKNDIHNYKSFIVKSNHPKIKKLAQLLKYRLRNFKIVVNSDGMNLPSELFINNYGQLVLEEPYHYRIEIDYDFERTLHGKYIEKIVEGYGPVVYPPLSILEAKIHYSYNNIDMEYDITNKYSEYYAKYEKFIDESLIWKTFKLWEFENCIFKKIVLKYYDGTNILIKDQNVKYNN